MLIFDIADDLLDQIFDGDEAVGTAIFVDHQRELDMRRLHLHQQIEHRHRWRHKQDRPLDFADSGVAPAKSAILRLDKSQHVLEVNQADGIVECLAIDRKPRMLRLTEQHDKIRNGGVLLDRHDVGARDHDIADLEFTDLEQIGEHRAFLRRKRDALALAFLDELLEILAHRRRGTAAPQHLRKPLEQ